MRITILFTKSLFNDFVIIQPPGLDSGGFDLIGGQSSSLVFTIDKTSSDTTGLFTVKAKVSGTEVNSGREINDESDPRSFIIEEPPEILISSTTVIAPNTPDINTGQVFQVKVTIVNDGGDAVKSVFVGLERDSLGQSIFSSPFLIGTIPGDGQSRDATFSITASQAVGMSETFTSTILSAKEENTGNPVTILPSVDSTATINIEKPAGLEIVSVTPSQDTVLAGQGIPNFWDVVVVVQDTGGASITFDEFKKDDLVFRLNGEIQDDYTKVSPENLEGGDRILETGERDTLIYVVRSTGGLSGTVDISVSLSAKDDNNESRLEVTRSGSVVVKSAAIVQLIKTEIEAPHLLDQNNAEVNRGATFKVIATVENKASENVKDVWMSIISTGGSELIDTSVSIPFIPARESRSAEFEIRADSQVNPGETFTVRIDSARSQLSNQPASIQEPFDATAIAVIENPAVATVDLSINDQDGLLSVEQAVEVSVSLVNNGGSRLVGTGRVELIIPQNYELILGNDTSYVAKDTVDIVFGTQVHWNLVTPKFSQGPDTLIANLLVAPKDENTDQDAIITPGFDETIIETISGQLLTEEEIIDPEGAKDGIVSTEQEFELRSIIQAPGNFDTLKATLILPSPYKVIASNLTQDYDDQGIIIWRITAPAIIDQQKRYLIIQTQATDEFGTTVFAVPDSVEVETVKRANLRVTGFISEPQGALDGTLSANQPFTIRARIENLGKARTEGAASVSLNLGFSGVTVQEPLDRPFVFDPDKVESVVDWHATAPNQVTPTSFITVSIDTIPDDENTNQLAQVSQDQFQIQVQTVKAGDLSDSLWISFPEGATDSVLSTDQQFKVRALVTFLNAEEVTTILTLPPGFDTENNSRLVFVSGAIVSWDVTAPSTGVQNQVLVVQSHARDENDSNREIFSIADSIALTVVQKARVQVVARVTDPFDAKEGIVSTEQEFTISATVENAGAADLKGESQLRLVLPAGFSTVNDTVTIKETSNQMASWRVKAPVLPSAIPQNITVFLARAPNDENTNDHATVDISVDNVTLTVEQKKLEIELNSSIAPGAFLKGAKNVGVLGLNLRNSGGQGSSSIIISRINLYVRDENNENLPPNSIFSYISVRNSRDTTDVFGAIIPGSDNPMTIPLDLLKLKLEPGILKFIGIYVDILPTANTTNFYVTFLFDDDIDAIDENTQKHVFLVNQSGEDLDILTLRSDNTGIVEPSFSTFGNYPNPFGRSGSFTKFFYVLEEKTGGELRIYTLVGDLVRVYSFSEADDEFSSKGPHDGSISWDGKNGNGDLVLNGVYIAILTTNSGKQAMTKVAVVK